MTGSNQDVRHMDMSAQYEILHSDTYPLLTADFLLRS